jgi:hypothetical protein
VALLNTFWLITNCVDCRLTVVSNEQHYLTVKTEIINRLLDLKEKFYFVKGEVWDTRSSGNDPSL